VSYLSLNATNNADLQLFNAKCLHKPVQIREVCLYGEQKPWVLAQSIALLDDLAAVNFDLQDLADNSLGDWLYSHESLKRSDFALHSLNITNYGEVISRSSIFSINDFSILVRESFLPQLWQKLNFI